MGLRLFEDEYELCALCEREYYQALPREIADILEDELAITSSLYLRDELNNFYGDSRKNKYNVQFDEIYIAGLLYRQKEMNQKCDNIFTLLQSYYSVNGFRYNISWPNFLLLIKYDLLQRIGRCDLYGDLTVVGIIDDADVCSYFDEFVFANWNYRNPVVKQSVFDFLTSPAGSLFLVFTVYESNFDIVLNLNLRGKFEDFFIIEFRRNLDGTYFIYARAVMDGSFIICTLFYDDLLSKSKYPKDSFTLNDCVKWYDEDLDAYINLESFVKLITDYNNSITAAESTENK